MLIIMKNLSIMKYFIVKYYNLDEDMNNHRFFKIKDINN